MSTVNLPEPESAIVAIADQDAVPDLPYLAAHAATIASSISATAVPATLNPAKEAVAEFEAPLAAVTVNVNSSSLPVSKTVPVSVDAAVS